MGCHSILTNSVAFFYPPPRSHINCNTTAVILARSLSMPSFCTSNCRLLGTFHCFHRIWLVHVIDYCSLSSRPNLADTPAKSHAATFLLFFARPRQGCSSWVSDGTVIEIRSVRTPVMNFQKHSRKNRFPAAEPEQNSAKRKNTIHIL